MPTFTWTSTLTAGRPRHNDSGTLLEGIALWEELKTTLTFDDYVARALRYCDWAVGRGLLAIRSHVDTTDPNLTGVKALLDVSRKDQGLSRPAARGLSAGRVLSLADRQVEH